MYFGLLRKLALLITLTALSGCPKVTTLTTAKTIGAGRNDITVSPGVMGVGLAAVGSTNETGTIDTGLAVAPVLDVMYRRGIGDMFDLGVTLSNWGNLGIDGKINFLDTEVFALAVDPGIGGFFFGAGDVGGGYLQFDVPLLMDIALGDTVRITFAPKYVGILAFAAAEGTSVSDFTHLVGLTGGVEIKVGRVFRIMPHGGFMLWVNKPDIDVSPVWFTGGVALKFVFPAEAPAPVRPMYPPGAAPPPGAPPPGAAPPPPPPPPPGPDPEPVPAPDME